jgi:hypothetical protein
MRKCICRELLCLVLFSAVAISFDHGYGAEYSASDLETAKWWKAEAIRAVSKDLTSIQSERVRAARLKDQKAVNRFLTKESQLKAALAALRKRTVESIAAEKAKERAEAEAAAEDADRQLMLDEQEAKEQAARAARQKEVDEKAWADDEKNRQEKSGNCPLRIVKANFCHADSTIAGILLAKRHASASTVATYQLTNMTEQPAVAYEVHCEYLDGFDKKVAEESFTGAMIAPGETIDAAGGIPPVEVAVQMRITIERVRLADGTSWERKPEHERIGKIVQRFDGADAKLRP